MMFLLRAAFWLSVVLVLLPTGGSKQDRAVADTAAPIGAIEAASAAGAAVSDMRQFCSRQPEACAVGTQALIAFGHRAQAGAQMLYGIVSEKLAASEKLATPDGSAASSAKRPIAVPSRSSQSTLTRDDLGPQWQGPPA